MTCPKWMRATLQTKHLINQIGFWESKRERQIEKRDYCEGHLPLLHPLLSFILKGQTHFFKIHFQLWLGISINAADVKNACRLHQRTGRWMGCIPGLGWHRFTSSVLSPGALASSQSCVCCEAHVVLSQRWYYFCGAAGGGRINLLVAGEFRENAAFLIE